MKRIKVSGSVFWRRVSMGMILLVSAVAAFSAEKPSVLLINVDDWNDWDFWVYPPTLPAEARGAVHITPSLDKTTTKILESGGTVLLLPQIARLRGNLPQCFTSTYWCCVYASKRSQTMGMICDPKHPLFAHFPTDKTTNWNWHELLVTARPMILDQWDMEHAWPKSYRPLIQPVNDWNTNYKLALLAEARVGKGRIIVCSMDLTSDLDTRPVVRQFRYSLLQYMNGAAFDPDTKITIEQLRALYRE